MKIRKAGKKNMEGLWEIEIENRKYHKKITNKKYNLFNKNKIDKKSKEEYLNNLKKDIKNQKIITLVAIENEKVVGTISAYFSKWKWSDNPPKYIQINDLGVLIKYKQKGIATKLIKEVEKIARSQKIKFIYLGVWANNNSSIKFYQKNKYEKYRLEMIKKIG